MHVRVVFVGILALEGNKKAFEFSNAFTIIFVIY